MWNDTKERIKKAERIGIMLPPLFGPDEFGAAFALRQALLGLGKTALFTRHVSPPEKWRFLPAGPGHSAASEDFVISVPVATAPIKEIRYEKDRDFVHIVLSPKTVEIKAEHLRLGPRAAEYDLVITVGIASPEHFGKEFEENPSLFYKKPVINIDISELNEKYGIINAVDPKKSSLSELVYEFLTDELEADIAAPEASWLLAGIIEKTDNFRNVRATPGALETASFLLEVGADKELIIKNIYKHRPLPLLKLWGRAAVRSRFDEVERVLWTFIPASDFSKTETTSDDLFFVLKQMQEYFLAPRAFVVLFENPHKDHVRAIVRPVDAALVSRLGKNIEFSPHHAGLLFSRTFTGFPEAEEHMAKILTNPAA